LRVLLDDFCGREDGAGYEFCETGCGCVDEGDGEDILAFGIGVPCCKQRLCAFVCREEGSCCGAPRLVCCDIRFLILLRCLLDRDGEVGSAYS
jgi:hypothetical protein